MPIKNLTNNHSNPAAGMRRLALVKVYGKINYRKMMPSTKLPLLMALR